MSTNFKIYKKPVECKFLISLLLIIFINIYSGIKTITIPMDSITGIKSTNIKTVSSLYQMSLPIPDRWSVKSIKMVIKYTNSNSLLKDISQLVLDFNEQRVGQVVLDPEKVNGKMTVKIPSNIIRKGYNNINFIANQHYMEKCEQWDAPNLWTNILFASSSIIIKYTETDIPLKLSEAIPMLFDPKIIDDGKINIVMDRTSIEAINAAAQVTSGIAKKYSYKKLEVTVSDTIKENVDNIILGTNTFCENIYHKRKHEIDIEGDIIRITHVPLIQIKSEDPKWNKKNACIIISGKREKDFPNISKILSISDFSFPGNEKSIIKKLKIPEVKPYTGKNIIQPGKKYTFKNLNFKTHTFRKINPLAAEINFRLPDDYYIEPNKHIGLYLNFVYSPGMNNSASLTIKVNDIISKVIALDKNTGEFLDKYKIDLPSYLFSPGKNKIVFTSYLTPDIKACRMFMPDAYFLTLYDNSNFIFPTMSNFVTLPKLELFAENGFPYTRWVDGQEMVINLLNQDINSIQAAMNIVSMITQLIEHPLFGLKIVKYHPFVDDVRDKENLVIGTFNQFSSDYYKNLPIRKVGNNVVSGISKGYKTEDFQFIKTVMSGNIDNNAGLIMGMESPLVRGRSIIVLSAGNTAKLNELSKSLLDPGVRANIKGGLSLLELKGKNTHVIRSIKTEPLYWTGKYGKINYLVYFFVKHRLLIYIATVILILIISFVLYFILSKVKKRRLNIYNENVSK